MNDLLGKDFPRVFKKTLSLDPATLQDIRAGNGLGSRVFSGDICEDPSPISPRKSRRASSMREAEEESKANPMTRGPVWQINPYNKGGLYHSPGTVTTLMGTPGIGKTTIALTELVLNAAKGIKSLYLSLEMNIGYILSKVYKVIDQYGLDENVVAANFLLEGSDNFDISSVSTNEVNDYVREYLEQFFIKPNGEFREKGDKDYIAVVCVDYLQDMILGSIPYVEARLLMTTLVTLSKKARTSVMVISQVNRKAASRDSRILYSSDAASTAAVEHKSHVVIGLHPHNQTVPTGCTDIAFNVLKNRDSFPIITLMAVDLRRIRILQRLE